MMPLGEFIAELREVSDYDIRAVVIDETLAFMASNAWVALWKDRTSDEAWISVIEGG
jgi:phosphatidylglycerophosphatase A